MGVSAAWAAVAISAGSAYASNQNAKEAQKQQKEQQRIAQQTLEASDQANNQKNQKKANGSALLSANQAAAKGGISGTMLTGPGGVANTSLQLGKTTLLGGGGNGG